MQCPSVISCPIYSLPRWVFFCPGVWCLTLREVRISCKLVSSYKFQCYPWRCRRIWRHLFHPTVILLWIFLSWFSSLVRHFDRFIFKPWILLSTGNYCCIRYSSCGVLRHKRMMAAKRKWLRYFRSLFKPLVSLISLRNMLSIAAVNSLGEMVFPSRTPLRVLIALLSLCRWNVVELLV